MINEHKILWHIIYSRILEKYLKMNELHLHVVIWMSFTNIMLKKETRLQRMCIPTKFKARRIESMASKVRYWLS